MITRTKVLLLLSVATSIISSETHPSHPPFRKTKFKRNSVEGNFQQELDDWMSKDNLENPSSPLIKAIENLIQSYFMQRGMVCKRVFGLSDHERGSLKKPTIVPVSDSFAKANPSSSRNLLENNKEKVYCKGRKNRAMAEPTEMFLPGEQNTGDTSDGELEFQGIPEEDFYDTIDCGLILEQTESDPGVGDSAKPKAKRYFTGIGSCIGAIPSRTTQINTFSQTNRLRKHFYKNSTIGSKKTKASTRTSSAGVVAVTQSNSLNSSLQEIKQILTSLMTPPTKYNNISLSNEIDEMSDELNDYDREEPEDFVEALSGGVTDLPVFDWEESSTTKKVHNNSLRSTHKTDIEALSGGVTHLPVFDWEESLTTKKVHNNSLRTTHKTKIEALSGGVTDLPVFDWGESSTTKKVHNNSFRTTHKTKLEALSGGVTDLPVFAWEESSTTKKVHNNSVRTTDKTKIEKKDFKNISKADLDQKDINGPEDLVEMLSGGITNSPEAVENISSCSFDKPQGINDKLKESASSSRNNKFRITNRPELISSSVLIDISTCSVSWEKTSSKQEKVENKTNRGTTNPPPTVSSLRFEKNHSTTPLHDQAENPNKEPEDFVETLSGGITDSFVETLSGGTTEPQENQMTPSNDFEDNQNKEPEDFVEVLSGGVFNSNINNSINCMASVKQSGPIVSKNLFGETQSPYKDSDPVEILNGGITNYDPAISSTLTVLPIVKTTKRTKSEETESKNHLGIGNTPNDHTPTAVTSTVTNNPLGSTSSLSTTELKKNSSDITTRSTHTNKSENQAGAYITKKQDLIEYGTKEPQDFVELLNGGVTDFPLEIQENEISVTKNQERCLANVIQTKQEQQMLDYYLNKIDFPSIAPEDKLCGGITNLGTENVGISTASFIQTRLLKKTKWGSQRSSLSSKEKEREKKKPEVFVETFSSYNSEKNDLSGVSTDHYGPDPRNWSVPSGLGLAKAGDSEIDVIKTLMNRGRIGGLGRSSGRKFDALFFCPHCSALSGLRYPQRKSSNSFYSLFKGFLL